MANIIWGILFSIVVGGFLALMISLIVMEAKEAINKKKHIKRVKKLWNDINENK